MKKITTVIVIVIVAAAGWVLLSPLFLDSVVDESFPETVSKEEVRMLEKLTEQDVEAMSESERLKMQERMEEVGSTMPDKVMDEPEPAQEPVLLSQGSFVGADTFHKGSGIASLFQMPDGSHLLRFENFSVTNGPALSVYMVKDPNNLQEGYIDLGKLKGNKGNQNYLIPKNELYPSVMDHVLIYCVPFKVKFAIAPLQ